MDLSFTKNDTRLVSQKITCTLLQKIRAAPENWFGIKTIDRLLEYKHSQWL